MFSNSLILSYVTLYIIILLVFVLTQVTHSTSRFLACLCAVCLTLFVMSLWNEFIMGRTGYDFRAFWIAGRRLLNGLDPYDPSAYPDFVLLNPPTVFPLTAVLSLLPRRLSEACWLSLNLVGTMSLVPFALRILDRRAFPYVPSLHADRRIATIILMSVFALSLGSYSGLRAGQLSSVTTIAILAALDARGRGHPMWSGFFLAVASIKTATLIPFLMLFGRREDCKTWVVFGLVILALSLSVSPPRMIGERLKANLRNISDYGGEGRLNDYSFANRASFNLIGFDRLFYCCGLRDRAQIRIWQLAAMGFLGALLGWDIVFKKKLQLDSLLSLTSCYSMLFLYHRFYDTSILVLPLVYCVTRLPRVTSWGRWRLTLAAVALLGAMQGAGDLLYFLYTHTRDRVILSSVVECFVLPLSTWLIVCAFFLIWWSSRAPLGGETTDAPVQRSLTTSSPTCISP
jgi:type III secretory pathway component EscS